MKNKRKMLATGIIILICIVILIGFAIYVNKNYLNTTLSEYEAKKYEKYLVHLPNPQDSIFKYIIEHSELDYEEQTAIGPARIYRAGPELYNIFYQCSIIQDITVFENSDDTGIWYNMEIWYDTEDGTEVRLSYTDDDTLVGWLVYFPSKDTAIHYSISSGVTERWPHFRKPKHFFDFLM